MKLKHLCWTALLCLVTTAYFPADKFKFKYVRTNTQMYTSVRGMAHDSSDAVLAFINDTLRKTKFILINRKKYDEIGKFNLALMKEEMITVANLIGNGTLDEKGVRDHMRNQSSNTTPLQSLTIEYTSTNGPVSGVETCDSVGFTYKTMQARAGERPSTRVLWSINDIKSRVPDSVALFILKKM